MQLARLLQTEACHHVLAHHQASNHALSLTEMLFQSVMVIHNCSPTLKLLRQEGWRQL